MSSSHSPCPSVAEDLDFTATGLAWVVNGYLLAFAGFMLLGGRAADLFGPRRMLVTGLALFSTSSLVVGPIMVGLVSVR